MLSRPLLEAVTVDLEGAASCRHAVRRTRRSSVAWQRSVCTQHTVTQRSDAGSEPVGTVAGVLAQRRDALLAPICRHQA